MDLYEALKSGTSEKELLDAFHKDLEAATARLAEEQKQAEEAEEYAEYLEDCRWGLAEALLDYIDALFYYESDENESVSDMTPEEVYNILKQFEEDCKNIKSVTKKISEAFSSTKEKEDKSKEKNIYTIDDKIIRDFLKLL